MTSPPVLDASCAVAALLGELEVRPGANAALRLVVQGRVLVPAVFWYEVRHALVRARRRNRVDADGLALARQELRMLSAEADASHDEDVVFRLVERHGLSFYDAAYLETAIRRSAALVSVDRKLFGAAKAEGVSTLPNSE